MKEKATKSIAFIRTRACALMCASTSAITQANCSDSETSTPETPTHASIQSELQSHGDLSLVRRFQELDKEHGILVTDEEQEKDRTAEAPTRREGRERSEGVSRPTITATLESSSDPNTGVLKATLTNNSETELRVTPILISSSYTGVSREKALEERLISAKVSVSFELPVMDLPVQTAGVATAAMMAAYWRGLDGKTVLPLRASGHSRPVFITHTEEHQFANAVVRTSREQRVHDANRAKAGIFEQATALRILNETTGVLESASPATLAELPRMAFGNASLSEVAK